MKTTVEISDALLNRARRHARKRGMPVRALIEEGLRLVLASEEPAAPFELPDCSVGKRGGTDPLEGLSWQDLRAEIYGGR
jgi:hypothetical protein